MTQHTLNMNRIKVKGELISFRNPENYLLDGILYDVEDSNKTVIHIHGSYGNFYQNLFLRYLAKSYNENGYNFLSFNLRAHDGFAEGYQNVEDFEYVGGATSEFETYFLDMEGAINFAKTFSKKIVLEGHSMGCDRVIDYMLRKKETYDCILLSPSDSYMIQTNWLKRQFGITVEQQLSELEERLKTPRRKEDIDWLPFNTYGIYYTNEEHFLPVSAKTMYSVLRGASFWTFNITKPTEYYLDCNCFVYLGGKDELLTCTGDEMIQHITKRFKKVTPMFLPEAEHMIENVELNLCRQIAEWLQTI